MSIEKILQLQKNALYPDNGVFQFTGMTLMEYRKAIREDEKIRKQLCLGKAIGALIEANELVKHYIDLYEHNENKKEEASRKKIISALEELH